MLLVMGRIIQSILMVVDGVSQMHKAAGRILHAQREFKFVENVRYSRVPIIKLHHVAMGIDVDLSFNSPLGVHNRYVCP